MEKRYRALRLVSAVYKILAVIGALATVVLVVVTILNYIGVFAYPPITSQLNSSELLQIAAISAGELIGGWFGALTLYALGSFIDVFIATEENTRQAAAVLNRVSKQLQNNGARSTRVSAASAARAADATLDDFDLGAI